MSGAHHLTPESIAATVADLKAIQEGTEAILFADRDHRTWAGVLALIIEHAYAEGRKDEREQVLTDLREAREKLDAALAKATP
jgi:hypothetical protein